MELKPKASNISVAPHFPFIHLVPYLDLGGQS